MAREWIPKGRELDAQVAELALGFTRIESPGYDAGGPCERDVILAPPGRDLTHYGYPPRGAIALTHFVPNYSTRLDDAWTLVERFKMSIYPPLSAGKPWVACAKVALPGGRGHRGGPWNGEGETVQLAICRAAIKAGQATPPQPSRDLTQERGQA